jgi:hypothetical protein
MDDVTRTASAIDATTGQTGLPEHYDLRRLHGYWSRCRRDRLFPSRADIDPVDFAFMLNRVALTEVYETDPRDPVPSYARASAGGRYFRFRVVGSWWRDVVGREMTGSWADDMPDPRMTDITVGFYERMIALRQPLYTSRDAWIEEKRLNYQILILPLSDDGERISMIMTAIGPNNPIPV